MKGLIWAHRVNRLLTAPVTFDKDIIHVKLKILKNDKVASWRTSYVDNSGIEEVLYLGPLQMKLKKGTVKQKVPSSMESLYIYPKSCH